MKHTPGPWKVWKANEDTWEICETKQQNRHSHFASVRVGNFWNDEGKANAHLLAAAPDLLEACKWIERNIKKYNNGEIEITQFLNPIKQAISRAEGSE